MKKKQHIDVLGESFIPEDLFTSTEGLNWGLDGYPDLAYGAGVLEAEILGESKYPPNTPDGTVRQAVSFDSVDLTGFMQEASITDLSYLDLAEQDPDRLPKNPVALSVPELEAAWGMDQVTDGIHLMPNVDRDIASYRQSLESGKTASGIPKKVILDVVSQFGRKMASGVSYKAALEDLQLKMATQFAALQPYVEPLKSEQDLLGRVYIQASHYPDCASGRWDKIVRKYAGEATYLIQKKACGTCVHAQQGRCALFKKTLVASVPWEQAIQVYEPVLTATGRKPMAKNAKLALQAALRDAPKGMSRIGDVRPTTTHIADTVSDEDARRAFQEAPLPAVRKLDAVTAEKRIARLERQVAIVKKSIDNGLCGDPLVKHIASSFNNQDRPLVLAMLQPYIQEKNALQNPTVASYSGLSNDMRVQATSAAEAWEQLRMANVPSALDLAERALAQKERVRKANHQKMVQTLTRWRDDGLLNSNAFDKLSSSSADPANVLKLAMSMLSQRQYEVKGRVAKQATISEKEAWTRLKKAEQVEAQKSQAIQAEMEDRYIRGRVAKVVEAIHNGVRGTFLQKVIQRTLSASDLSKAAPYLNPILRQTRAHLNPEPVKKVYQDVKYKAHVPKKASQDTSPLEVRRLLRWASRQMNEGFAGNELDQLIQNKFSPTVVQAASVPLQELRQAHEGLAGHAYVHADSYASASGYDGCNQGGLQHRANAIPAVMQMDRCASCTSRSIKADGTMMCRVYNKALIKSASEIVDGDPRQYQKEMIRLANGNDSDRVASLFANAYDPSEFNLGADSELDNIPLDEQVSQEKLANIMFGGWEIE